MGSPISLGTVSPHRYEEKTIRDLRHDAMVLAQRIEASPFYICGIDDRDDIITINAHLEAVMTLLEANADKLEEEANGRVGHFEFEGQR